MQLGQEPSAGHRELLLQHGAVLFRGFKSTSASAFMQFASYRNPTPAGLYRGRLTASCRWRQSLYVDRIPGSLCYCHA